jgi:hypothetical protein
MELVQQSALSRGHRQSQPPDGPGDYQRGGQLHSRGSYYGGPAQTADSGWG